MALAAFARVRRRRRPALPAPGRSTARTTRRSRTRTSSAASPLPTTRGVDPRRARQGARVEPPVVQRLRRPGRVMPSARRVRTRNGARRRASPTRGRSSPRSLRLNPEERARFEARDPREARARPRRRQVAVLAPDPRARGRLARHRRASSSSTRASSPASTSSSVPVRYYPYKNLGAHMLGYVARDRRRDAREVPPAGLRADCAREEQQKRQPARLRRRRHRRRDRRRARVGELPARAARLGEARRRRARPLPHRTRGRAPARRPDAQEPIPGRDLRLTIDVELEQAIERAMRPHAAGAVVVVDVRTGRLLALYSKPDFDPERSLAAAAGKARVREAFNTLYADPLRPMLDKTMSGAFQPGSTFKPFTALAALEDNARSIPTETRERATATSTFGRRIFRCTHVHGKVEHARGDRASRATSTSSSSPRPSAWTASRRSRPTFGLGEKTGLGVNPEAPGRIPTRSWYALRYHGQFRIGFTLNTAIGAGRRRPSRRSSSRSRTRALANGGTLYSAAARARGRDERRRGRARVPAARPRSKVDVQPGEPRARRRRALRAVVNDPKRHRVSRCAIRRSTWPERPAPRRPATSRRRTTTRRRPGTSRATTRGSPRSRRRKRRRSRSSSSSSTAAPGPTHRRAVAMQIVREYERLAKRAVRTRSRRRRAAEDRVDERRSPCRRERDHVRRGRRRTPHRADDGGVP